ncbi:hypothetical protein DIPPA_20408 [Diplonema papillatum]|nr:hypothetical protein DIPPA_20408 [Diplonema papillatum]
MADVIPELFSMESLEEFHSKVEWELDQFLSGINDIIERPIDDYLVDNQRAFSEVRRRALKVAAEAYIGKEADERDIDQLGVAYSPGADMVNAAQAIADMAKVRGLSDTQEKPLKRLSSDVSGYAGVAFVHPQGLQLQRICAAVDTAREVAVALPEDDAGDLSVVAVSDCADHYQGMQKGAELVTAVHAQRRRMSELAVANDALAASAADYDSIAAETQRAADMWQKCSTALIHMADDDPCGLIDERDRRSRNADDLEAQLSHLRLSAKGILADIIAQYQAFTETSKRMCTVAHDLRKTRAHANRVDEALQHFMELIHRESEAHLTRSSGASASAQLAGLAGAFMKEFTTVTKTHIKEHISEANYRLESAQSILHDAAARYFQRLQREQENEKHVIEVTDQKIEFSTLRTIDPALLAGLEDEKAAAARRIEHIRGEMMKVRALLESHGVAQVMRVKLAGKSFLDEYDREQAEERARAYFETLLAKVRACSDVLAEVTDTPPQLLKNPKAASADALESMYAVLISVTDANTALVHAEALPKDEQVSLAAKLKRSARTAAMNFSELNHTHPAVLKIESESYPLPDGTAAASLFQIASPTFTGLEAAVRVVTGVSTGSAARIAQPIATLSSTSQHQLRFFNVSPRLRVAENTVFKPEGGKDLADGSALCYPGLTAGTGVHSWSVRLTGAEHLMVGLADADMSVTAYCNAVRHPRAYFLNVTTGTLWSSALRHEGHPFWPDPLDEDGSMITLVVDTDKQTISYAHNGIDLGVAYVGIDFSTPLHPAFEGTTCDTKIEVLVPKDSQQPEGP